MADKSRSHARRWLHGWFEPAILLTVIIGGAGTVLQLGALRQSTDNATRQLRIDANNRREDFRRQEERETRELAPHLVVHEYCNHRRIGFCEWPDKRIELALLQDDAEASEEERAQMGYVAEVKNIGGGPALHCQFQWRIDSVEYSDGRIVSGPEVSSEGLSYFHPMQIDSKDFAKFEWVPRCIATDTALAIRKVVGAIDMSCEDVEHRTRHFVQKFWAETNYRPADSLASNAPEVLFHFTTMEKQEGAFPAVYKEPRQPRQRMQVKPLKMLPDYLGGWGDAVEMTHLPTRLSEEATERIVQGVLEQRRVAKPVASTGELAPTNRPPGDWHRVGEGLLDTSKN